MSGRRERTPEAGPNRVRESPDFSVLRAPPGLADRQALGRAARAQLPFEQLGQWNPAQRAHDALATVLAQNEARLQDLVPIRMARMAVSPWTYYRGAAAVMAADLATTANSGLFVQMCGDAHVLNFGLWATPERQLSFDLRDFDETLPGPFEWDVKRYLASLVVLARDNGLTAETARKAVSAALLAYRTAMARYAQAGELETWYDLITAKDLLDLFQAEDREQAETKLQKKSNKRSNAGAVRKLTVREDGQLRIVEDPPLRVRLADALDADSKADPYQTATQIVQAYYDSLPVERRHLLDRFALVDVVRQVVGVGSVGMAVYLVLLDGRLGDDPLFLQFKQAGPSVYEPFLGSSATGSHGERVVQGRQLIQAASDIFLGWTSVHGRDFYIRQFRDMKIIPDGQVIAPYLAQFAAQCGSVLARAHARTGDAVAINHYIGKGGKFDKALLTYAFAYADQTERDHRQLADSL